MKEGINKNRGKDESLVLTTGTGFASASRACLTASPAQGTNKTQSKEQNLKGSKNKPKKWCTDTQAIKNIFTKQLKPNSSCVPRAAPGCGHALWGGCSNWHRGECRTRLLRSHQPSEGVPPTTDSSSRTLVCPRHRGNPPGTLHSSTVQSHQPRGTKQHQQHQHTAKLF